MADTILDLRSVTRIHNTGAEEIRALDDVSLSIRAGTLIAIMGPSGSGKSTLLNIAGGLDVPTSGEVLLDGVNIASLDKVGRAKIRRQRIGYVFQDYNLIPTLTVGENVSLPLELDGVTEKKARSLARSSLDDLGVGDLIDRFPTEISRGQAQRAAIARALVGEDRILMADEPTGALDSQAAEEVLRLMRARVDAGSTGILVTHEARFAAWADDVVLLRDGAIVSRGERS